MYFKPNFPVDDKLKTCFLETNDLENSKEDGGFSSIGNDNRGDHNMPTSSANVSKVSVVATSSKFLFVSLFLAGAIVELSAWTPFPH